MWVDFFPDECDEAVKEYGLFYMDEEGPAYNKKNGDTITVHFVWEDYEAAGKIAVKDTQEYTVEGLGKYVRKANQEALQYYTDKMLAKAQKDVIQEVK